MLTSLNPVRVYVILCCALGALMIGQTTNQLWSNPDFWVWLGPVRELAKRPFDPTHPLLAIHAPDSYMGPTSLLLGLVTRLTGADPVNVMAVGALVNVALFMLGIWRLSRLVSTQSWAPPLALAFSLVAWGWHPLQWSGYLNLSSIGMVLPLGSTFAFAVGLFVLAAMWKWLHGAGDRHVIFVALVFPVVLLTHQMAGLWVALIAAGFIVGLLDVHRRDQVVKLLVAGIASAAIVLAWPYYSMLDLLSNTGGFDAINYATYRRVAVGSALAAPGVVILLSRLRHSRRDPLALGATFVAAVFIFGWVTHRGSLGRVFPGLMLVAHLAMADWFANCLARREFAVNGIRLIRTSLAALMMAGVWGTAIGWIRSVPREFVPAGLAKGLQLTSYVEPNLAFADYFHDGDVVVASNDISIPIAGSGAKVISVVIPEPFVDDADQRSLDSAAMVDPSTDVDQRDALLARYTPDWLVALHADAARLLEQLPDADAVGDVNGYTIIRLKP